MTSDKYESRRNSPQKFWLRVMPKGSDECWPWGGYKLLNGYGRVTYQAKSYLAHRLAYELTFGPIPAEGNVCHTCDNPPCCNPAHLFLGTYADNAADMHNKGRGRKLETYQNKPRRTHCNKGHELTPDNIVWTNGGKARRCLICYRTSNLAGTVRYVANHREEVNLKKRQRRLAAKK